MCKKSLTTKEDILQMIKECMGSLKIPATLGTSQSVDVLAMGVPAPEIPSHYLEEVREDKKSLVGLPIFKKGIREL